LAANRCHLPAVRYGAQNCIPDTHTIQHHPKRGTMIIQSADIPIKERREWWLCHEQVAEANGDELNANWCRRQRLALKELEGP
jgi:hypothetical protein